MVILGIRVRMHLATLSVIVTDIVCVPSFAFLNILIGRRGISLMVPLVLDWISIIPTTIIVVVDNLVGRIVIGE